MHSKVLQLQIRKKGIIQMTKKSTKKAAVTKKPNKAPKKALKIDLKLMRIRHYPVFTRSYGLSIIYKAVPRIKKGSMPHFDLISGLAFRKIRSDQFSRKDGREHAFADFQKSPVVIVNYPGEDLREAIFRFLKNEAYKQIMAVFEEGKPELPKRGDIPPKLLMEIANICVANKSGE
jgi:hypothetical protein